MLKPITVKDAISVLAEHLFANEYPIFYLRDNDGGIHTVDSFDLMRDRITCEDGYFDYYKYVIQSEGVGDRLFIEE